MRFQVRNLFLLFCSTNTGQSGGACRACSSVRRPVKILQSIKIDFISTIKYSGKICLKTGQNDLIKIKDGFDWYPLCVHVEKLYIVL